MIARYQYRSIDDTLEKLSLQVLDSLPYAQETCPVTDTPEQLFDWFKERVKFESDPDGVELLQTMQTLFEANYHGTPGLGDCDCFTIASLACLIYQPWLEGYGIALAGRSKAAPVHIYVVVKYAGEWYDFDLTAPEFNTVRPYPYTQIIEV